MSALDQELDRLYGLPLEDFTAARNELARRLRSAGQEAEAETVRTLAKPNVAAWAVNQLSRRDADTVRSLLEAGAELAAAQERLLAGSGGPDAIREPTAQLRDAVSLLGRRARGILADAGRAATPATMERVAQLLHAAATDEEGRRLLESGRLTGELEPAGFDAFAAVPPASRRRASSVRDELAERRRAREARQQRKRDLQRKARELEQAAQQAERDADRAAADAAKARQDADKARAAADEAAAELAEPE